MCPFPGVKSLAGFAMEPDVIRIYSSSPPPMEDGAEEEEDEFSDFTGVPNSVSFTEFDTPTTFNQLQALNATSPPELITSKRIVGLHGSTGSAKSNGGIPSSSQGDGPACRTVSVEELKKTTEHSHTNCAEISGNDWTGSDAVACNGGVETLTNGFATFDTQGTPDSCRKHRESGSPSVDPCPDAVPNDNGDDFADFAAFSDADISTGGENWENSNHEVTIAEDNVERPHGDSEQGASIDSVTCKAVDNDKDACVTGFASLAFTVEVSEGLSNGDWGFCAGAAFEERDSETDDAHQHSNTAERLSTEQPLAQNGVAQNGLEAKDKADNRASPVSVDERGSSSEPTEEKGSGNDTETETETETSFGRPLSTDALEEFGDFSTTGSVPSPPLQEETATPADHSQLAEDDDEDFGDFGDFGDASAFGSAGFGDFDQQGATLQALPSEPVSEANPDTTCTDEEEFGDFDAPRESSISGQEAEDVNKFADFPASDSFADFSSAPLESDTNASGGWQAFNEPGSDQEGGESWAAFSEDQGQTSLEKDDNDWHEGQSVNAPPSGSSEGSRKDSMTVRVDTHNHDLDSFRVSLFHPFAFTVFKRFTVFH